jgi:Fe-S cluster assembly iron-binding protein IscA
LASSTNRIRRITVTAGGTHYMSYIVDAASRATGSVTENQRVSSYVDADAADGVKRDKYVTEES